MPQDISKTSKRLLERSPMFGSSIWRNVNAQLTQVEKEERRRRTLGVGAAGLGIVSGRYTLGLVDVPFAFAKRAASKELKEKLRSKGLLVRDVGTVGDPAWRISDKKGETRFINPDNVTEGTYNRDLLDFLARHVGVEVTPEMRTVYSIGKFVGAVSPIYKLTTAGTGNLPFRPFAARISRAGLTGFETSLTMQVEDVLAERRGNIDFVDAIKTGGWFTLFAGTMEGVRAARIALADAHGLRQFFGENWATMPKPAKKEFKLLFQMARDAQEGMPHKAWLKKYGWKASRADGAISTINKYKDAIKWKPAEWRALPAKAGPSVPAVREGKVFYHGTSKEGLKSILEKGVIPETEHPLLKRPGRGFFVSRDIGKAKRFGDRLVQITLKPNAKMATPENLGTQFFTEWEKEGKLFNVADVIKEAKRQGYDAVDLELFHNITREPVSELVILNKNAVEATRPIPKPEAITPTKPTVTPKVAPAKTLYHGSVRKLGKLEEGVVYLAPSAKEAKAFGENIYKIEVPKGKTKDISKAVDVEVAEGDVEKFIREEAKRARKEGYDYLTFNHPSGVRGRKEFEVTVAIRPKQLIPKPSVSRDDAGRFIKKDVADTPLPPSPKDKPANVVKNAKKEIEKELKGTAKRMANKKQKMLWHILSRKKGWTETQRRDELERITGKRSTVEVTEAEMKTVLDADEFAKLLERQSWEPTHITIDGDIISQQAWLKAFREPGLGLYLTPKEYYLRLLGLGEMVQPLSNAAKALYLENIDVSVWAKEVEKRINKIAKPSTKDKLVSKLLRRSTKPVQKTAVLLNQYEHAPNFLSPAEKVIFSEIRGHTKDLLHRANIIRERLGLPLIKDIGAYMTHWLDGVARQAIAGKYPFPHEVEYWIGRRIPKKIRNPLAEERKIRDDLLNYFSRDLGKLLSVMARYELRDIYLSEPYSIFKGQLDALKKEIPKNARNALDAFVKHDIFMYPTELDELINTTLSPLTALVNLPLKALGQPIITNPVRALSVITRTGIHLATIAGRPILAIRNTGQRLLLMDLYPQVDFLRAQFWPAPKGLDEMLKKELFYQTSRHKIADIPGHPIQKASMWLYQKAHISNVLIAMRTGYYYGDRMIRLSQDTNSGFYRNCIKRFTKRMSDELKKTVVEQIANKKGPFYDAFLKKMWNKEDALAEATEAGMRTQWSYFITDMPRLFRGHGSRAMLTLQSWWQNYFFNHWREGMIRTFTGETSRGKYIRPRDRANFLKGQITLLAMMEALRATTGLDYKRFYVGLGPAPLYLTPVGQVTLGLIRLMTAKNESQRKRALTTLKQSYRAFIPGSMAWKDLRSFLSGETNLKQYLFYTEQPKKEVTRLRKTRPARKTRETK